ncbi:Type 1 glutamine amidotransferase-like domain-containing protein [Desulfosoma caldarium]|uniref:Peptidase S51-like protein n=1 Tax=Desulfosoma caldarium TaxID=610254 RepID=A0A3N1VPF2_9BACT|nr:Type 1 glutamine amidotransferase-like domain-containing protein [Desulfosoma caldarium]ROR02901.1 peptidase S51-like protein [Desulfosoma caldarium]
MNPSSSAPRQQSMPAGILVLMGSGEFSSGMVEVHKALLRSRGSNPFAVFIDTPAGFQQNVDEISRRAQVYFQTRVGHPLHVVSLKSRHALDTIQGRQALKRLEKADYMLMGPGSPTYVARQWIGTPVPDILRSRLESGAVVVAASAAAISFSWKTLPVYEIYKVGMDLHWADGLDLLGPYGLRLVIVPHWNNAEGGTHDTRFCYMGKERFQLLEAQLPDKALVVGLDEHTALTLDFTQETATVRGVGTVTLRQIKSGAAARSQDSPSAKESLSLPSKHGPDRSQEAGVFDRSSDREGEGAFQRVFASGHSFPLNLFWALANVMDVKTPKPHPGSIATDAPTPSQNDTGPSPSQEPGSLSAPEEFWKTLRRAEDLLQRGLEHRLPEDAARALLDLDRLLWQSSAGGAPFEDIYQGRKIFREWLVQVAQRLTLSFEEKRTVLDPLVDDLVHLRQQFREKRLWQAADALRSLLAARGVAIDDTPSGPRRRWVDMEG